MNRLPSRIPRGSGEHKIDRWWENRTCEEGRSTAFSIKLHNLTILHVYDSISLCREFVVVGHNDEGRTTSLV